MRTLSTFIGTAAILIGLTGLTAGCVDSPEDILTAGTSFTATATATATATDTNMGTETGSGDGDGDPATGDGDGDATATGDGDGDAECGSFNAPCCEGDVCDMGLECQEGLCQLEGATGDGDGDATTGPDPLPEGAGWDPNDCPPPGTPIGVQGIEGGFCSYACTGPGMEATECPATPDGVVPGAQCALDDGMGGSFCALVCTVADGVCPDGATCQDIMQNGLGICTWPG